MRGPKEGGQRRRERRGGGSNRLGNGEKARARVNERLMEGGFVDAWLGRCDKQTASASHCHRPPRWA